jgi:hypothetical protein
LDGYYFAEGIQRGFYYGYVLEAHKKGTGGRPKTNHQQRLYEMPMSRSAYSRNGDNGYLSGHTVSQVRWAHRITANRCAKLQSFFLLIGGGDGFFSCIGFVKRFFLFVRGVAVKQLSPQKH